MTMENRCCGEVWKSDRGSWRGGHREQCSRTGTAFVNGEWYCKTHDPVAKAEKEAKRHKEWEKQRDIRILREDIRHIERVLDMFKLSKSSEETLRQEIVKRMERIAELEAE